MEPALTITPPKRLEHTQLFKPSRTELSEGAMQDLVGKVAEEQEFRKAVISNPYAKETQQAIGERFGSSKNSNVIRAAVLAEPEGAYDKAFREQPRETKIQVWYWEIDISADAVVGVTQFVTESQDFDKLPDEEFYTKLTKAAFGTTDQETIEQRYSQSQRRGIRGALVNIIEDRRMLAPYKEALIIDDKSMQRERLEQLLGEKIQGEMEVESVLTWVGCISGKGGLYKNNSN